MRWAAAPSRHAATAPPAAAAHRRHFRRRPPAPPPRPAPGGGGGRGGEPTVACAQGIARRCGSDVARGDALRPTRLLACSLSGAPRVSVAAAFGGAIHNQGGELTMTHCTLKDNRATSTSDCGRRPLAPPPHRLRRRRPPPPPAAAARPAAPGLRQAGWRSAGAWPPPGLENGVSVGCDVARGDARRPTLASSPAA